MTIKSLISNIYFLVHASNETSIGEEVPEIEHDCHTGTEIETCSVPEDSTITVEVHNEDSLSLGLFSYISIVISIIIDEF